jgi:hypothetical protein
MNLNRVYPHLLDWAEHHGHLREITAPDIHTATTPLTGSPRRQTFTALRSLFRHLLVRGTPPFVLAVHDPGLIGMQLQPDPVPLEVFQYPAPFQSAYCTTLPPSTVEAPWIGLNYESRPLRRDVSDR